jgi:drug/metabolite transporter (DMT)-like permease
VTATASTADAWKGIGLMLLGAGLVIGCDAISKLLASRYPVEQVLGIRQIVAIVPLLVFTHFFFGLRALRPVDTKGLVLRGILFCLATVLVIISVKHLPLPTVNSIGFSAPILVAALSLRTLKEPVNAFRWLAIAVGFAGVLLIVRPGTPSFAWILLVPICVAFTNGFRDIYTRHLTRTDSTIAILFWSFVVVLVFSLPTAPFTWIPVAAEDWWLFLLSGCVYATAHFLMIEAFRFGNAAAIASYRYSGLIWSVLYGYLLWDHLPDIYVFLGAALIAIGGITMLRQEVRGAAAP